MATKVAERVVLDTNILLEATDEKRVHHARAVATLDDWPARGTSLYTSGQILREYLAVSTRPVKQNGLGLSRPDALANVRVLRARARLLVEDEKVADRLLDILAAVPCTGKRVHDANVVATMLVHGIATLVTLNADDFDRFGDLVTVLDLGSI